MASGHHKHPSRRRPLEPIAAARGLRQGAPRASLAIPENAVQYMNTLFFDLEALPINDQQTALEGALAFLPEVDRARIAPNISPRLINSAVPRLEAKYRRNLETLPPEKKPKIVNWVDDLLQLSNATEELPHNIRV